MTGYGFTGPWTARGTVFDAKAESVSTGGRLLLLGAGSYLLWFLIHGWR